MGRLVDRFEGVCEHVPWPGGVASGGERVVAGRGCAIGGAQAGTSRATMASENSTSLHGQRLDTTDLDLELGIEGANPSGETCWLVIYAPTVDPGLHPSSPSSDMEGTCHSTTAPAVPASNGSAPRLR